MCLNYSSILKFCSSNVTFQTISKSVAQKEQILKNLLSLTDELVGIVLKGPLI